VISGLDQLPTFLPFLTKESLQPFNAALKGIMNKTEPILITLNGSGLFSSLAFRKFMDRNLIFPLGHKFFLFLDYLKFFILPEVYIKDSLNFK
jgi:hypothetical protein